MTISSSSASPNIPRHIGIIMDGNNRWARKRFLPGVAGHRAGIERVRDMLYACREIGVEVLTVFAFSSENWQRPPKEVSALMSLFHQYLTSEAKKLKKDNVRLKLIGNRDRFEKKLQDAIEEAEALTADGEQTLVIAADYGGRWDIANAAQQLAQAVKDGLLEPEDVTESLLDKKTSLTEFPPLDLLIRTGGEYRISNFLLWQAAYAELYFSPLLWPDFDKKALREAVDSFAGRERRFGLNGEQIKSTSDLISTNNNRDVSGA